MLDLVSCPASREEVVAEPQCFSTARRRCVVNGGLKRRELVLDYCKRVVLHSSGRLRGADNERDGDTVKRRTGVQAGQQRLA